MVSTAYAQLNFLVTSRFEKERAAAPLLRPLHRRFRAPSRFSLPLLRRASTRALSVSEVELLVSLTRGSLGHDQIMLLVQIRHRRGREMLASVHLTTAVRLDARALEIEAGANP